MKNKLDLGGDDDDDDNHSALIPIHHFQELHSPQNLEKLPYRPPFPSSAGADGASIEVAKRRRGRPPGSKNKPKPPVVIMRVAETPAAAMRPHVLEIPVGHDVTGALALFARRRGLGLCVLSGTGSVSSVALRQPSQAAAASICFHGRFEILSLSAMFLPPLAADAVASVSNGGSEVSISLAGPQGQVVGGTVAGPLMAAGTVVVVAAAFSDPTFFRLPMEDDASHSVSGSRGGGIGGGDGSEGNEKEQSGQEQSGHRPQHVQTATTEAESAYSGRLSADTMWAPAGRMPLSPPY